jgi:DNA-binding NtrC family response regulator
MHNSSTPGSPDPLHILFADDEVSLRELMSLELPRMGHRVSVCANGHEALTLMAKQAFDCLIVDLDMPGLSGIEVIEQAGAISPGIEAVILTGKSSIESAIAAVRHGVFDYLTKPCKLANLKMLLEKVAQKRSLEKKFRAVQRQLLRVEGSPDLVGDSSCMDNIRQMIERVAPTSSTVLVLGETGTGKELVARAIHQQSRRQDQPFVAVNCGALPESLIESELFGHRKGAFTGAEEHRSGLFEVADGGTLLLDEIGELPRSMQAKLLRVLESGEIRRVGDNQVFEIDARVICATHRDLATMVADGEFRQDLMFRINAFEITLPSLRQHVEDIPQLVKHLSERFLPTTESVFTEEAMAILQMYSWPGNVRELVNAIEHATILCDQLPIEPRHLPERFQQGGERPTGAGLAADMTLRGLEMQAIHAALARHTNNKRMAAEELGISLKTLYNKLNSEAA